MKKRGVDDGRRMIEGPVQKAQSGAWVVQSVELEPGMPVLLFAGREWRQGWVEFNGEQFGFLDLMRRVFVRLEEGLAIRFQVTFH
jgi:hypothetical protein